MRQCLLILLGLVVGHAVLAAPPRPQTRPWRIGIAGAFATGYQGLLSLHGFPRERIDDNDIDSLDKLKQYDIIIIGYRSGGLATAKLIEEYVRGGGIALTETLPVPTVETVPGQRVGPLPAPNLRFVDSGTPITAGCPELGVIPCAGLEGYSVIPDSRDVKVLARYTDEGAPQNAQGKFVGADGKGMPAILMIPLGQGVWIYSGASLSWLISMPPGTRGRTLVADQPMARPLEPLLVNLLKVVSGGQLVDRLYPCEAPRSELATERNPLPPPPPYETPTGAAQAPPAGYDKLEAPAGLRDFAVSGKLPATGETHLLISYWSPQSYRELVINKDQATLNQCAGAKQVALATGPMPAGASSLVIMRRHGLLTLRAGGKLVLAACDGPAMQGALAVKGLTDASYQPLDVVDFADDFMRETAGANEWTPTQGTWHITATEGKPGMGANPFDYEVTAADKATSINGNWFWSDYRYVVRVKAGGAAAGIIADYQDAGNYLLLRLQPGPEAKLQLLRFQDGQPKTLGETAVSAASADWHKLGLCTSHGVIAATLDGRNRLQAYQADQPIGRIGLYCENGAGCFDHVLVKPWVASGSGDDVRQMRVVQGKWRGEGGVIYGAGSDGARLLAPWDGGGDGTASVSVKLGGAKSGGLHVRYADPNKYYLLALTSEGGQLKVRLTRAGNPEKVLAEQSLPGPTSEWHKLALAVQDARLNAYVDDRLLINRLDTGHVNGDVGLYSSGAQSAGFRDFQAAEVDDDQNLVDELTPAFAGIIDQHTWAGRSGAWVPDPEDLDTFWHTGYFPDTSHLQVGLHAGPEPACRTTLYLSKGHGKDSYALEARRNWAADTVPLTFTRAGKTVAEAEAHVKPGKPFAVGLFRAGSQFMAEVDGAPVALYTDPEPLPNPDSLGIENKGGLLYADDLRVTTPDVHDYTFEAAPTDWMIESGAWEISSRWSCTPGWAWFSGFSSDGYAAITTKQAYAGDQEVVLYVAAKMMPAGGDKHSEKLTDINVGLLVNKTSLDSGYQFVLGGMNNTMTVLRRNGVQVAASDYRLPQAGMHNDWTKVTLRHSDNHVECWVWDTLVLQYDDPEPLSSGRVAVGTYQNGIIVPRITIFGKQVPVKSQN